MFFINFLVRKVFRFLTLPVSFINACDFSCNFNATCSGCFISLQHKDDHLNEFLSSLGDPSSPVDFDFTSGKY